MAGTGGLPTVIVTGAGSGIGRATALTLAARGHHVGVNDLDPQQARDCLAELEAAGGQGSLHAGDVSRDDDAARVVNDVVATTGRLDGLVNNAGVQAYGSVLETDDETWDRILGINLGGVVNMSRHAVPHLERSRGAIVNVASVQATLVQPRVAAYSASKGAVLGLTRAMAVDGLRSVRVNAVCPGGVATPFLHHSQVVLRGAESDPEEEAGARDSGGAPASQIADVIAFLLSREASNVTGVAVTVDGGLTARIPGT